MINISIWGVVFTPLVILAYGFFQIQVVGDLLYWSAEPGKYLSHFTGQWAVSFLLLTLAVTPLRRRFRMNLIQYRRRLGLAAFFYGVLHVFVYAALILGFQLSELLADFAKRPYITVGILALLAMLPMAITSTKGWQRRLKNKWKTLHQLIYPATLLIVIHLWWQVRQEFALALGITLLVLIIGYLRFTPNKR